MRSTRRVARMTTALALVAALALIAALVPATALAHAELESTDPVADATLERPPAEVAIVFSGELDPAGSSFVVTGEAGEAVGEGALDLAVADRSEIRGTVTITVPGRYTVAWTSTAFDGHQERGEFSFTVASEEAATGTTSPDTAVAADDSGAAGAVGTLLLLAAMAIRARRNAEARS